GRWTSVELTAARGNGIFMPEGVAHGFQTLAPATELLYLISEFHDPPSQRGIRWDDPQLAIDWPDVDERVISERDRTLPLLCDVEAARGAVGRLRGGRQ